MLYFSIFLGAVFLLIFAYFLIQFLRKKWAKKKVKEILDDHFKNLIICKHKAFDFQVNDDKDTYLFKIIYHFSTDEININARHYWQINHGAVSSRKKGNRMPNVYDLIDFDLFANGYSKNTKKIYIIYPYSKSLMKVINECEMIMINPQTDIYGTSVINYRDLQSFLDDLKR